MLKGMTKHEDKEHGKTLKHELHIEQIKLRRRDTRCHQIAGAILQIGIRGKRKTRKGSDTKNLIL